MLRAIWQNMQPVVKNLLIINLLFFLATLVAENQQISLSAYLGLFYPDSLLFEPYQLATHFFMHGGLGHLLFNMIALIVFGSMLERVWGAKRFLLFFFITAIGAALVYEISLGIQINNITGTFFPFSDEWFSSGITRAEADAVLGFTNSPAVGASGAIYGLIIGAAMYFPNRELYLYAVLPIKVKWLAVMAIAVDVIQMLQNRPDDHTAHFAHLGGALIGFIMIKIWQRSKSNFY